MRLPSCASFILFSFVACGSSSGGGAPPPSDLGDAPAAGAVEDGDSSDAATPDPQSGENATPDASTTSKPPTCDPKKPFANPVSVLTLSDGSLVRAAVSADEKSLFYALHPAVLDMPLFLRTRAKAGDAFGAAVPQGTLRGDGASGEPLWISDDLLTMYVHHHPTGSIDSRISRLTRTSATSSWGTPTLIEGLDVGNGTSTYALITPFKSGDEIYYTRQSTADGIDGIFRASLVGPPNPMRLTELAAADEQRAPILSADGLTIYFSTDRTTFAEYEIWRAHRASKTDPFKDLERVVPPDPKSMVSPVGVSADDCRLYVGTKKRVDVWTRGAK